MISFALFTFFPSQAISYQQVLRHQALGVFASVCMIFQADTGLLFQVYDWADADSFIIYTPASSRFRASSTAL